MAGKTMSDASSSNFGGAERGESVVYDCRRRKSSCGYCKSGSHGSITHGSIDFNYLLGFLWYKLLIVFWFFLILISVLTYFYCFSFVLWAVIELQVLN